MFLLSLTMRQVAPESSERKSVPLVGVSVTT